MQVSTNRELETGVVLPLLEHGVGVVDVVHPRRQRVASLAHEESAGRDELGILEFGAGREPDERSGTLLSRDADRVDEALQSIARLAESAASERNCRLAH